MGILSFIMDLKVLVLICFFGLCYGAGAPGAPWTPEETEIIYRKIMHLYNDFKKNGIKAEMRKRGYDDKEYTPNTNFPSAAKVLRLAFHDCVPYADGKDVNGCDGCLHPGGMGTDFLQQEYNDKGMPIKNSGTKMGDMKFPDVTKTDHNGLLYTADLLEVVYTDPAFPKIKGVVLEKSMKESGKSRADLWHFAALVAIHYGANNNNLACNFKSPDTCGHYRYWADDCEMSLKALNSFKTGRKDCTPNHPGFTTSMTGDEVVERDFFTKREEIHPNLHANGVETTKYFKDNFGFTARESIALLEGAHSFGKFHREVSMHKYAWNRMQDRLLNNQQFRNIANEPMFKANCIKSNPLQLLGNAKGEPAQIEWQVNARRVTKNGGPFQWWKRYQMCDSHVSMCLEQPGQCAAYDKCLKGFAGVNPTYGGKLCNPKCEKSDTVMETSLAADVGLYYHFESDPKTGQPHGCAFPENLDDWQEPD